MIGCYFRFDWCSCIIILRVWWANCVTPWSVRAQHAPQFVFQIACMLNNICISSLCLSFSLNTLLNIDHNSPTLASCIWPHELPSSQQSKEGQQNEMDSLSSSTKTKVKPSSYNAKSFHGVRVILAICAIIVGSILGFFCVALKNDGYKIPWTFLIVRITDAF